MNPWFLDRDSSCHWYLIPNEYRSEWYAWCNLNEDDPASWEAPEFARRLDGSPANIIFDNPRTL